MRGVPRLRNQLPLDKNDAVGEQKELQEMRRWSGSRGRIEKKNLGSCQKSASGARAGVVSENAGPESYRSPAKSATAPRRSLRD